MPNDLHGRFSGIVARHLEAIVSAAAMATGSTAANQVLDPIRALLLCPSQVLAEPRGGKNTKKRNKRMLAVMGAYERGELEDDPEEPTPSVTHKRKQLAEEVRLAQRVQQAAEAGSISIAARRLEDAKLADASDPQVMDALRQLHPEAAPPQPLECSTPALQIDSKVLSAVLARVKDHYQGRAGGPSGWTFEMILAVTGGSAKGFNAALQFVNLILSGQLPRQCGLLDSVMIALKKPNGGIRPIAIGEVWYRLAAMCAIEAAGRDAGQLLAPLQVGVGVSGGTDAVPHCVNAALAADEENIALTVDFRNAFNEIHLQAVLDAVREHCPQLLALVQFSYGAPAQLHVSGAAPGTVILSKCGVRQGDPLGPLLFALGLHSVLTCIKRDVPEVAAMAYLDDYSAVGRGPALRKVLGRLVGDGPGSARSIGLTVVPRKCGVFSPHEGAQEECSLIQQTTGVPHRKDGLMLVGTPVGEDDFVRDAVAEKTGKVVRDVNKLMKLPPPCLKQTKFQVLRQSLANRLNHLQRTVPWALLMESTRLAEGAIIDAVTLLFNVPRADAAADTPLWRRQLALPTRHGGFGLRETTPVQSEAAFFTGLGAAQCIVREGPATLRPLDGAQAQDFQTRWSKLREDCPALVEKLDGDKTADLSAAATRANLSAVQHCAARAEGDAAGKAILEPPAQRPLPLQWMRDAARFRSCAGAAASGWLLALPVSVHTTMGDSQGGGERQGGEVAGVCGWRAV